MSQDLQSESSSTGGKEFDPTKICITHTNEMSIVLLATLFRVPDGNIVECRLLPRKEGEECFTSHVTYDRMVGAAKAVKAGLSLLFDTIHMNSVLTVSFLDGIIPEETDLVDACKTQAALQSHVELLKQGLAKAEAALLELNDRCPQLWNQDAGGELLSAVAATRRPTPLSNKSNTCFLNAVMQCLFHEQHFMNCFENETTYKGISAQFRVLLGRYIKGKEILPRELIVNIQDLIPEYLDGVHQDAHEYIQQFILKMQCDMNTMEVDGEGEGEGEGEGTSIRRVFGGQYSSQITCSICETKSETLECFRDLSLGIISDSSTNVKFQNIEECLHHYFSKERLKEGFCSECNSANGELDKQLVLMCLPKCLVLQLKIFDASLKKLVHNITSKLNLSVKANGKMNYYKLTGIVVHLGDYIDGGHYVAYVLGFDNQWYLTNDAVITKVTEQDVLKTHPYISIYSEDTLSAQSSPLNVKRSMAAGHQEDNETPHAEFFRSFTEVLQQQNSPYSNASTPEQLPEQSRHNESSNRNIEAIRESIEPFMQGAVLTDLESFRPDLDNLTGNVAPR